jgi:hypothetical protein
MYWDANQLISHSVSQLASVFEQVGLAMPPPQAIANGEVHASNGGCFSAYLHGIFMSDDISRACF